MKTITCWNCGTQMETGRAKTCACGAFVTPHHDPYVYSRDIGFPDSCRAVMRWFWKCHHCGSEAGPFRLRREADESAGGHMNEGDEL